MSKIHPTAIVDPKAQLHGSVEVGPYSVIHAGVTVGEGTKIHSHVVLDGPMTIGRNNTIYPFASVGAFECLSRRRAESDFVVERDVCVDAFQARIEDEGADQAA